VRQSRQDQSRKIVKALHCDFAMYPALWAALEAYRADKKAQRAPAIRKLLEAQLRLTGHLAPLKRPEDAAHLEDVAAFPWSTAEKKPGLVWFSRDPSRLTWATLFDALENETATKTKAIAERHGISNVHAYRIFRRFDLWRRGQDHRPRLDPFATPRGVKPKPKRRKKTHAKAG